MGWAGRASLVVDGRDRDSPAAASRPDDDDDQRANRSEYAATEFVPGVESRTGGSGHHSVLLTGWASNGLDVLHHSVLPGAGGAR